MTIENTNAPSGAELGRWIAAELAEYVEDDSGEALGNILAGIVLAFDDTEALDALFTLTDRSTSLLQKAWGTMSALLNHDADEVEATFGTGSEDRRFDERLAEFSDRFLDNVEQQLGPDTVAWLDEAMADYANFRLEAPGIPEQLDATISRLLPTRNQTWLRLYFDAPNGTRVLWAERQFTASPTRIALYLDMDIDALEVDERAPPAWAPTPLYRYHPERFHATRPYARSLRQVHPRVGLLREHQFDPLVDLISRELNRRITTTPRRETWKHDSSGMRVIEQEVAMSVSWSNFVLAGRQIFEFPERLIDMFLHTDAADIPVNLIKLPFPMLYLRFGARSGWSLREGWRVDGCYIEHHLDPALLVFRFTSIPDVPSKANEWHASGEPALSFSFTEEHLGMDLGAAIDVEISRRIQQLREEKEHGTEMREAIEVLKTSGELAPGQHIEIVTDKRTALETDQLLAQQSLAHRCMHLAANALCYLTAYPDDVELQWPEGTPPGMLEKLQTGTPKQRLKTQSQLEAMGYTQIRLCGAKLRDDSPKQAGVAADGKPMRAHWRRGHWRRQAHGEGRALRKMIWLMPVLVNSDGVPGDNIVTGHVYRAE